VFKVEVASASKNTPASENTNSWPGQNFAVITATVGSLPISAPVIGSLAISLLKIVSVS
jgi:hypothetical protein